jgi:PAS domain-containing protein
MDIGAVKRFQEQLERSQTQLLETVELMQEPVLVLNEELQVTGANRAFRQTFGLGKQDTVGMPVFELANKQWNIPRLRNFLQQLVSAENGVDNVPIDHQAGSQEARRLTVSGRRISLGDARYWAVLAFGVAHAETRS